MGAPYLLLRKEAPFPTIRLGRRQERPLAIGDLAAAILDDVALKLSLASDERGRAD